MVGIRYDEKSFCEEFDIVATASFVLRNGFRRVALQFPDELLGQSVAVSSALDKELSKQIEKRNLDEQRIPNVRLFVMGDTTFGSCCADEIAAMHVDAQCIVHYGHTCMSVTSRLPVWFVFGRALIDAENCATWISKFAAGSQKPILVMVGLKYIHAAATIQEKVAAMQDKGLDVIFASCPNQLMEPAIIGEEHKPRCRVASPSWKQDAVSELKGDASYQIGGVDVCDVHNDDNDAETSGNTNETACTCGATGVGLCNTMDGSEYKMGGLKWIVARGQTMADYVIFWIGGEDPGLTNISLIFNLSTVVRYDPPDNRIVTDVVNQSRFLQRRYYYVERAKDANIVGIVVGTLAVAGYREMIQRIRRMVEEAGKKAYILVMGKPNPSKLANFPECEVFVLVACPQTALLDSKEFLAPLITPFEAELAFLEGKQWTGVYKLDFGADPAFQSPSHRSQENCSSEPRFSFFTGSYVRKDTEDQDGGTLSSRSLVPPNASQHALALKSESSLSVISTKRSVLDIRSGADYLASRTYSGLDINQEGPEGSGKASLAVVGHRGRAAGYTHETN